MRGRQAAGKEHLGLSCIRVVPSTLLPPPPHPSTGPGHYPEGNAWIKNSHHYSASPSKQRVNFKRVPSAPSIPARGQSYGYEEGTGGTLVMQQPQDPIHTGGCL